MSLFQWMTPAGEYFTLYRDMLEQPHLLIAGATGSGKSVVINALIYTALYRSPNGAQFILIDPKRVELAAYKDLPHTITHAAGYNPAAWITALTAAVQIMDERYTQMERQHRKMYDGGDLYVIIDEWANVYKSGGGLTYSAVLRLTSEGRAARVHVIMATQVPKATIIPTEIRENFAARLCLRTANAVQSRVIMEQNGCEQLPRYGQGYYMTPEGLTLYKLPMIDPAELDTRVAWWERQKNPLNRLRNRLV